MSDSQLTPVTGATPSSLPTAAASERFDDETTSTDWIKSRSRSPSESDDDLDVQDYLDKDGEESEEETFLGGARGGWTEQEEKAIIKKFDRRLALFMALLYLMSFLDRSNIGNARIAGLSNDLNLTSDQYDWLLTAFYITYIVFEWMTLMYKLVPPHVYISICVFSWGLLASVQSVSNSFAFMLSIRALLGVAEAAFGPGVPFYLSFFYKRSELAFRVGLFIAAAPLATSFASSLAWVIVRVSQNGPIAPWRALFLVEGFPSVVVAMLAFYWIPDSPSDATYLTERERWIATLRLRSDTTTTTSSSDSKTNNNPAFQSSSHSISLRDLVHTLLDPPSYLTALMFLSCNVSFSSLPVFLPTIIHSMGFTSLRSQILSAPPYLMSFIFVLLISSLSDRLQTRSGLLIPVALLSSLCYLLIALAGFLHEHLGPLPTLLIRYISVYGAAMGFFASITLIITWTLNIQQTHTSRGNGMAILNIVGQMGPLIGTRLYPDQDAPYYISGMGICAGFMVGVAVLAGTLRFILARRNRRLRNASYEEVEMEERLHDGEDAQRGLMKRDEKRRYGEDTHNGSYRYIL